MARACVHGGDARAHNAGKPGNSLQSRHSSRYTGEAENHPRALHACREQNARRMLATSFSARRWTQAAKIVEACSNMSLWSDLRLCLTHRQADSEQIWPSWARLGRTSTDCDQKRPNLNEPWGAPPILAPKSAKFVRNRRPTRRTCPSPKFDQPEFTSKTGSKGSDLDVLSFVRLRREADLWWSKSGGSGRGLINRLRGQSRRWKNGCVSKSEP